MHGLPTIRRLNNPATHRFTFPPDYPMRDAAIAYEQGLQRLYEERVERPRRNVVVWTDRLEVK